MATAVESVVAAAFPASAAINSPVPSSPPASGQIPAMFENRPVISAIAVWSGSRVIAASLERQEGGALWTEHWSLSPETGFKAGFAICWMPRYDGGVIM